MDQRDWDRAAECLHLDVVVRWPHSREVFRGRDNFIGMNLAYPGNWRIEVERIEVIGKQVMSIVSVSEGDDVFHAVSFFDVKDGLITDATEYWCSPEERPEWRLRGGWGQRY